MVKTDFFKIRNDGVILVKTYSTENFYIKQVETGIEYTEAIDIGILENDVYKAKLYTYVETDKEISNEEPSVE